MRSTQVEYLVTRLGYTTNEWIDFADVPIIGLKQDTNCYTNAKTTMIKFNTTVRVIEISYGSIIEGVYTSHFGETTNYTPDSFITFDDINCFITSVSPSPYGTYYTRPFINTKSIY